MINLFRQSFKLKRGRINEKSNGFTKSYAYTSSFNFVRFTWNYSSKRFFRLCWDLSSKWYRHGKSKRIWLEISAHALGFCSMRLLDWLLYALSRTQKNMQEYFRKIKSKGYQHPDQSLVSKLGWIFQILVLTLTLNWAILTSALPDGFNRETHGVFIDALRRRWSHAIWKYKGSFRSNLLTPS